MKKKNCYLIVVLLFVCIRANAQSVQYGYTEEYRGSNEKTPLSGVAIFANGATAKSGSRGKFKLEFNSLKIGDRVNANVNNVVNLEGYVLFNKDAVEQWTVSGKDVYFRIVLCKKKDFDASVTNYYNISDKSYKDALMREQEKAKKLLRDGVIRQQEFDSLYDDAQKKYERLVRYLKENAELVARIDESKLDGEQQKILRLAKEGKIGEAVELIKGGNTVELFAKATRKSEYSSEQKEYYARIEAESRAEMKSLAAKMKNNIKILLLSGGNENIALCGEYYDRIIMADTTDLQSLMAAGEFYEQYMTDYKKARALYKKALRATKRNNPTDSFTIAKCYNYLGHLCILDGDFEKALADYNVALKYIEGVEIRKDEALAVCYNNIGHIYLYQSSYNDALEYYEKSRKYLVDIYGENSAEVVQCEFNMASAYTSINEYGKALELYTRALSVIEQVYGENHYNTATCYLKIGEFMMTQGKMPEAINYMKKSLDVRIAIFGPNHKTVAQSYIGLGAIYRYVNDTSEALRNTQKAVDILENQNGILSTDLAESYHYMGLVYEAMNELQKALEYHNKGLNVFLRMLGEYNYNTSVSYNMAAYDYVLTGEYDKALEYYRHEADIYVHLYGEDNVNLINNYYNVGKIYRNLKQFQKALESYDKALQILVRVYGAEHEKVKYHYKILSAIYQEAGDNAKSDEYRKKSE